MGADGANLSPDDILAVKENLHKFANVNEI
jgi:hypothetical protein